MSKGLEEAGEITTKVRAGHPLWKCEEVYRHIKRLIHTRGFMRHVKRSDLEFMMGMGLLVDDPSERVKVLDQSANYVAIYGGPRVAKR